MTKSSIEVTIEWVKAIKYGNGPKIKITTYKNGK